MITSYLLRDRLNETMRDKQISCLIYLTRKGGVKKLFSVLLILHAPSILPEPKPFAGDHTNSLCS